MPVRILTNDRGNEEIPFGSCWRYVLAFRGGWLLALVAGLLLGGRACGDPGGSLSWSPDGTWLVFSSNDTSSMQILPDGWWARTASPLLSITSPYEGGTHTLWICQAQTLECWPLAAGELGLSSGAWSPDGQWIAFGRLRLAEDGRMRCEAMVQRGFEESRVVASSLTPTAVLSAGGVDRGSLRIGITAEGSTPAWSPRGTYIAIPWLDPPSTAVVRVSDGEVLAKYPGARFPSWSPDEQHLALVLPGVNAGIHVSALNSGKLVPAISTNHASQAALWDPIDNAFLALAWRQQAERGVMPPYTAQLVRYDLRRGVAEVLRSVISRRNPPGEDPANIFFTRMTGTQAFFVVAPRPGEMTDILELTTDRRVPARRHVVLDQDLAIFGPTMGPNEQWVAVRFGPLQAEGVPAIYNLQTGELRAILPDRAMQLHATQVVIERILHILESSRSRNLKNSTASLISMPTPAALGQIATSDGRDRIEILARFGLGLVESRPGGITPPRSPRPLLESELFLSYVVGDYSRSLRVADALEPLLDSSHDRLALMIARIQCSMGQRRWGESRELLALLSQKTASSTKPNAPEEEDFKTQLPILLLRLREEIAESEK